MHTARNISWEIRGRRLVEGALVDQHVATGFGPDSASAIRWARRNEPAKTASFPDEDLRAIPDPINLPAASPLLASLVVLVCCCCIGCGGQPLSSPPDGFLNGVGFAADLPSQSESGVRNYFDRDLWAGLLGFAFAAGIFVWAGKRLDARDQAETNRRLGQILNDLNRTRSGPQNPGPHSRHSRTHSADDAGRVFLTK